MQDDRWNEIKKLFDKAVALPPEERTPYLQRACRGNESVQLLVESLIRSHEKSGSFMESPAYLAAANLLANAHELKPGEMIAHYRIRSLIGEGGMGKVYRAEDTKLERDVALKLLPTEMSLDDAARKRFLREARAAAALDHPNICGIYEVGEESGKSYIAMQYIEGETLDTRMQRGELSLDEVLSISIQLAEALSTAHARNVIHRDIKPSNLILTKRGDVKVLDFGLAKVLAVPTASVHNSETRSLLTQPGLIVGTVPYMSPEQARGQEVDARSDIWSLGVVIYEMITQSSPFKTESNSDTLAAILSQEPAPPRRYATDVPADLQRIVLKMLRKNREDRYQSAKDALIDLQHVRKQRESSATPQASLQVDVSTGSSKVKTKTALPAHTEHMEPSVAPGFFSKGKTLLASLLFVLIVGTVFLIWKVSRTPGVSDKPRLFAVTQVTTWSGLDVHPSLSPDGNTIAYTSDHNGSFEIYVRPIIAGAREIQITNDRQGNFEPAWSPDGQRIAYVSQNPGGIWIVPAGGGKARQVSSFGSYPAWSPDGTQIAFQSDSITSMGAQSAPAQSPSVIWVVDANGSTQPRQITQAGRPGGGHGAPAWSTDGQHIAMCVSDFGSTGIWIVSRDGSDARKAVNYGFDPVYGPDGESLYYTTPSGLWKTQVSPTTAAPVGEPIQLSISSSERIRGFAISRDGKKIVYSSMLTNSNLWFVPLAPNSSAPIGPPVSLTHDRSFRNAIPIFSPDGKRIAFNTQKANRDRGEGDIWIIDADGKNATQITTEGGGVASWFPGGKQLAFLSYRNPRTVWLANLETGQDKPLSWDFGEDVNYMRLSPDGKQVVFNSKRAGTTNVSKISIEGGEPGQLTFDSEMIGYACWSPDGKTLGLQVKRGGDTHIGVMPSDGGPITQLTFDKGQSWLGGFSPDGDKIVFAGFRQGFWNIFWVSRSTKEQKKLTNYTSFNAYARYPNWSPLGTQIAYEYTETTGNIWVAEIR